MIKHRHIGRYTTRKGVVKRRPLHPIMRAMNSSVKDFMRKGLQRKPVHVVKTSGLLAAARNLYNRGEISLEQMAEIERRAKENP